MDSLSIWTGKNGFCKYGQKNGLKNPFFHGNGLSVKIRMNGFFSMCSDLQQILMYQVKISQYIDRNSYKGLIIQSLLLYFYVCYIQKYIFNSIFSMFVPYESFLNDDSYEYLKTNMCDHFSTDVNRESFC